MANPIDYYITGNTGQWPVGIYGCDTYKAAQSFPASVSYDITSVEIYCPYPGSTPIGTLTLRLYAANVNHQPTGSILATGTFDVSNIIASAWYEITFSNPYSLIEGTQYILVASADCENVNWTKGTNGIYTNGKASWYVDSWHTNNDVDLLFKTYGVTPGAPTNPSPEHEVSDITLDESPLSWDASDPAADTYEIYFGEKGETLDLIGIAQAGVEYVLDFGYIDYEKTYEWRIDATNAAGTTTGTVWEFSSIVFDPPSAGTGGGGGGSGEESSPTGENNIITLRRLVVAVEDKIWYEDI